MFGLSTVKDSHTLFPSHTAAFRVTVASPTVWLCWMAVPVRVSTSSEVSGAWGFTPRLENHWENCPVTRA